jgi:hypothetical protein
MAQLGGYRRTWDRRHIGSVLGTVALAAVCLSASGCLTAATWQRWEYASREGTVQSVRVSDTGDVCVIYRPHTTCDMEPVTDFVRCVLVPAERVAESAVPWNPGHPGVLGFPDGFEAGYAHPSDPGRRGFSERWLARRTDGWTELEFVSLWSAQPGGAEEARAEEARAAGLAFADQHAAELPYGEGRRLRIALPEQRGFARWSIPVRVLLSPVTVVADVITAPLQAIAFICMWPRS